MHPLYVSSLPLEAKLATCDAIDAERGLPTIFKLTSCETDAELDRLLVARDHVRDAPTSVQTADLDASNAVLDPSVTVSSELTPA